MKSLFMETTEIPAARTVAEIQAVLARCGVAKVMTEFDPKTRDVEAVAFVAKIGPDEVPFRLPCRWRAILDLLLERRGREVNSDAVLESYIAKAKRVGWRQILRWVEAQMALVETKMVTIPEVFLPYMQAGRNGETVYQMLETRGVQLLIEGPR